LHNIKCLNDLLSIHKILGIHYICTQRIIGVCYTSTTETFLKLEACLSTVIVNYFNLLVIWVLACFVWRSGWFRAANNSTYCFLSLMGYAEPMSVVFEWKVAVVDRTAWVANSDAVNHCNRYLPVPCISKTG